MGVSSGRFTLGGFDLPSVRDLLLLRFTINHGPKTDGLPTTGLGFKTWAWSSKGVFETEWLHLSCVPKCHNCSIA